MTTVKPVMSTVRSTLSNVRSNTTSRVMNHIDTIMSNQEAIAHIDAAHAAGDEDLLHQIGYKQELRREYSTLQVFGIAFSIMGLLPSITTVAAIGLECGPGGLVWGWLIGGFFTLLVGTSMSFLGSAIPTSGGLFYYANYYCPDSCRVPLSFIIGCSNSLALCGGLCSINYGFVSELFAAVYISTGWSGTKYEIYGVFVAAILSQLLLCSVTTKLTAEVQTVSIIANVGLIVLFFIAVPIGYLKNVGAFNDAKFIFTDFTNVREWSTGWSFVLSWMPVIWTIGAFDSCIHMSEECKNPRKKVPIGIIGSITTCWVVGFCIVIVLAACIKDQDIERVLTSDTGMVVAQIVDDALGRKWAVAFMSLIAVAQYMMGASILIALSRQIFSFARDHGLPFVYNYVKVINPKIKVPLRATMFACILASIMGLLILIDTTAANALFSLAVAGNLLAWGVPVLLVILPTNAAKRFVPGPFYSKRLFAPVNYITCAWVAFVIVMSMFPDNPNPDPQSMNYTVVINGGMWVLALAYFFVYGYKHYHGPCPNVDDEDDDIKVDVTDSGEKV